MQKCLICLSPQKTLIYVNTSEWKKLQINFLIDKHLWNMQFDTTSAACKKCCNKLLSFHEFFVDVQKIHKVLVLKNFKTIPNEEFQKVLQNIYTNKNVHNATQLKNEILQHSNYIKEPIVASEPIEDDINDDNENQLNSIIKIEKNPLDLDTFLEKNEIEPETNDVFNESDYESDETDDLENSLCDLIKSLGKNGIASIQTDEMFKTSEKNKNTPKNLKEENEGIDEEYVFSDSESSWAYNEIEDYSKEHEIKQNLFDLDIFMENNETETEVYDVFNEFDDNTDKTNYLENSLADIIKTLGKNVIPGTQINEEIKASDENNKTNKNRREKEKIERTDDDNDENDFSDSGSSWANNDIETESEDSSKELENAKKTEHEIKVNNLKKEINETSCDIEQKKNLDKTDTFIAKHFKLICFKCKTPMETFSKLLQHFKKEHNMTGYVMCCNKKFSRRWNLHDHLILHNNPDHYKCSQCEDIFENRLRLTRHMRLHKNGGKGKYQCNICNAILKNGGKLTIHKTKHLTDDEKKHQCTECGKKFGLKQLLRVHTRIVHEKVYKCVCEVCGISYCSPEALKSHMLKRHMDKPAPIYPCDICGLKLSSLSVLTRHKRIRHFKDLKEYTCDVCAKVSIGLYTHKTHLRSHIKKYKCQICDKGFRTPSFLKNHMPTHTGGEAPHKCPWCPRTFNSNGNLCSHRKQKHYKEWLELKRSKYVDGKLPSDEEEK